jgi:hypothetical protein
VGALLLAAAIAIGMRPVSDAPEDFLVRGFRDLFQVAAALASVLNLTAALAVWRGWRWFGILMALLGLVVCVMLLAVTGFIALIPVGGYALALASLAGITPARRQPSRS